jgi:hypothetical protein
MVFIPMASKLSTLFGGAEGNRFAFSSHREENYGVAAI